MRESSARSHHSSSGFGIRGSGPAAGSDIGLRTELALEMNPWVEIRGSEFDPKAALEPDATLDIRVSGVEPEKWPRRTAPSPSSASNASSTSAMEPQRDSASADAVIGP